MKCIDYATHSIHVILKNGIATYIVGKIQTSLALRKENLPRKISYHFVEYF